MALDLKSLYSFMTLYYNAKKFSQLFEKNT